MLLFFQIPESSSPCSATHLGVCGARPPNNGGLTAQLRSKVSAVVVAVVLLLLIERGQAWRLPSHARFQLGLRREKPRGTPGISVSAAVGTTIMDHDTFPGEGTATVSSKVWGVLDGEEVHRIDLDTQGGFGVSFCTYGATLLSVRAGDRTGKIEEVTLQHETLEDLAAGTAYHGSTVGRVCNRISGAKFVVEGETFTLGANNGPNCLHSGFKAFDKVLWRHKVFKKDSNIAGVCFELDSPDIDQGFPGALSVKVIYSIRQGDMPGTGELHSSLEATHIAAAGEGRRLVPTPINLTNHAYWNLSGSCKRLVRGHELFLRCDRYLPLDGNQIPTGELAPVAGTFFDFSSKARPLGDVIDGIGGDPPGLDHCLVAVGASCDGKAEAAENNEELPLVARLHEPQTGRVMEVSASQPGVQVYTANFLSVDPVDMPHLRHNAVCLETQHFPNAVNQPEWADSVLIPPGGVYKERARHAFTVSALTEK